jgi:Holliday junction resolvase
MSESQIQKKMIDLLEAKGAYVVKVISANKKGVPDILCCYKGKFIAIEVKRPKTKDNVSNLQKYNLQKIVKAGGISLVAWENDQIEELLLNI